MLQHCSFLSICLKSFHFDRNPDFSLFRALIEFNVIIAGERIFLAVWQPFTPDFRIDILQSLWTFARIWEYRLCSCRERMCDIVNTVTAFRLLNPFYHCFENRARLFVLARVGSAACFVAPTGFRMEDRGITSVFDDTIYHSICQFPLALCLPMPSCIADLHVFVYYLKDFQNNIANSVEMWYNEVIAVRLYGSIGL